MKKILIILMISLIFASCSQRDNQPINDFESCVNAGYPIMESYPRQCNDGKNTYVEEIEEEKKACTKEYKPVCAEVQVQCIKAPCPPIKQTFGNECMAKDNKILYEGECLEEKKPVKNTPLNKQLLSSISNIEIPKNYSCNYKYFSGRSSFNEFSGESIVENSEVLNSKGVHTKTFPNSDIETKSINYSYQNGKENCTYDIENNANAKCSETNLEDYSRYSSWLMLENAKSDIFESVYNDNFISVNFNETENCFSYENYDKFANRGKSEICFTENRLKNYTFTLIDDHFTSTRDLNCKY